MRKIIGSVIALAALSLATGAWAANFTPGNIVVYRVGDGSTNALTNAGSPVFLDEISIADGSTVQSVLIPTNTYFGANAPLIASGVAVSEGLMTRSVDGRFLVFTGYATSIGAGSSSLPTLAATTVPRVIGTMDQFGHLNTTTLQTNTFSDAEDIRSATSTDGTNLWFSGDTSGLRYTTRGSTLAARLSTFVTNLRQINIYSNTLYFSDSSGSAIRIGTAVTNGIPNTSTNGLPTLTGTGFMNGLSNFPASSGSPYAFALFQLPGGTNTLNTLYVADDGTGGIYKYSLMNNGTWVSNGVVLFTNARYLVGTNDSLGNVQLYAAGSPAAGTGPYFGGGNLVSYTDTTGFNQPPTGNGDPGGIGDFANWAINPPNNAAYHGIAFAPVGGDTFPSGAGQISVGPITGFTSSGLTGGSFPSTKTYNIANPGTDTVTWAASVTGAPWVSLSASSGTLIGGASANVIVSFAAGPAAALSAGTNTASVTFTNNTSGNNGFDATSRSVTLIISDQTLTPSTDYTLSGQPGGPFTPASKVYTLSNGITPGTISYTVTKTANWLDLNGSVANVLSGSLAPGAGTTITVSYDTNNADALTPGTYADVLSFSNATAAKLITTRNASIAAGSIFFFDDFSTYTPGNLVGQQGWAQNAAGSGGGNLIISNNAVVIPGGKVVAGQWAFKNFPVTTNPAVFGGMLVRFDAVPATTNSAPAYTASFFQFNNGSISGGFTLYELAVGCLDAGASNFLVGARTSQQAGTPLFYNPTVYPTGTLLRVIMQTDINGTNTVVYINPTSATQGANTISILATNTGGFTPDLGSGGFGLRINDFADSPSAGASIFKVAVSTNFADVYNWITATNSPPPTDPFTTWQNHYFTVAELGTPSFSGPGGDPFGKGMSNTNQFLAGFNPTNAAAYVHITSITKTNGGTDIRVDYLGASGDNTYSPGFASRTNVLEFTAGTSGNYNSNNFASTGQTNILSGGNGSGTLANMVDPGGATNIPARYYRVRVLVP